MHNLWHNIREHHLTLGGGPWGGVAQRSREVFNAPGSFSPLAYVETCSTLAWLQLNRELLAISGDPVYADEIERTAYNDLLGAMAPNGEDWCYYSFANGARVHTTYWRCCKSSGAMAIEELAGAAFAATDDGGIRVDLLGPAVATWALSQAGTTRLRLETSYPFNSTVTIHIETERPATWPLQVRIPAWAHGAALQINGAVTSQAVQPGSYVTLAREWHPGDRVELQLPMPPWLTSRRCATCRNRARPTARRFASRCCSTTTWRSPAVPWSTPAR